MKEPETTPSLLISLLFHAAGICLAGLNLAGCGASSRPMVTWDDLSRSNSLPVTIEGTLQRSYLTGDSCYYSEWAYGVMRPDGSASLVPANQSYDSITVVTPHGIIRLDIFEIRTYVGSFYSRTFSPENAGIAPTPIQKLLEKTPETISVREYLLQPERTYYVRVRSDSAYGAPGTSGEAREVLVRNVLEICDLPFTEEKPPRSPTPAYQR